MCKPDRDGRGCHELCKCVSGLICFKSFSFYSSCCTSFALPFCLVLFFSSPIPPTSSYLLSYTSFVLDSQVKRFTEDVFSNAGLIAEMEAHANALQPLVKGDPWGGLVNYENELSYDGGVITKVREE